MVQEGIDGAVKALLTTVQSLRTVVSRPARCRSFGAMIFGLLSFSYVARSFADSFEAACAREDADRACARAPTSKMLVCKPLVSCTHLKRT